MEKTNPDIHKITLMVLFYMLINIVIRIVENIKNTIEVKLVNKIQMHVDLEIMNKYDGLEAEFFDNPENMDKLDLVKNSKMAISEGILWPAKVIMSAISFATVAAVFIFFSPILAFIYFLFSIPQAISTMNLEATLNQCDMDTIKEQRTKEYYKKILIEKQYAKDIRIYRSRDYFISKYNKEWNKILKIKKGIYMSAFTRIYRNEFFHAIGYIFVVLITFYRAVNQLISIGDLSVVLNTTKSSSSAFYGLFSNYTQFNNTTVLRIAMYLEFLRQDSEIKSGQIVCPAEFDIEFSNVFFKYPNECNYILEDITFSIRRGTKNAIVGRNGEGKSTIIKLLIGLYKPDKGEIRINGINIEKYDLKSLRRRFSVCFQEVYKYALTVEENISFSCIEVSEQDIIHAASFSGISNKIDSFSKKYKTELTKSFWEDGEELSGGQWQMLAIARSLYKNSKFWIMDEPSSALDPITEDRIMDLFAHISDENSILIVSHRLSSLQSYDQIIVINNRKVEEIGSHKELISRGGFYSQMYNTQKDKYQEG